MAGRLGYGRYYDKANQIYNKIISNWPDNTWAKNSAIESAKLSVVKYINEQDEPNALLAMEKLITDFNDRSDLPAIIMEMAAKSEKANYYGQSEMTGNLLKMVKSRYPSSPQSATIDLALERLALTEALDNNDLDIGEITSKFIDDHNSMPNLLSELSKVIEHYNILNGITWTKERNTFLDKKLIILEKIIEKVTDSYSKINFYKMSADLLKTRDTFKAIGYYQKILDTWPEYDEKGEILCSLGSCYNTLMAKKIIDRESIEPLMRETYEKVVREYPYTYFGRLSKYRLEIDERILTGKVGPAYEGGKYNEDNQ